MLCKILRRGATNPTRATKVVRTFSSEVAETENTTTSVQKTQGQDLGGVTAGRKRMEELRDNAYLEYKQYPNHIGHFNPDSPDYVKSEREEDLVRREVKGYNDIIDNFKNCLKLQEELYDAIEKMDRPYLTGTPGLDANVYDTVKDYSTPVDGYVNENEETDAVLNEMDGNKHRYIRNEMYHRKQSIPSNIQRWQ